MVVIMLMPMAVPMSMSSVMDENIVVIPVMPPPRDGRSSGRGSDRLLLRWLLGRRLVLDGRLGDVDWLGSRILGGRVSSWSWGSRGVLRALGKNNADTNDQSRLVDSTCIGHHSGRGHTGPLCFLPFPCLPLPRPMSS